MPTTTKNTTLSQGAKKLVETLRRRDVDHATVDVAAFEELRAAGLANVIFGGAGNRVFATAKGKAA